MSQRAPDATARLSCHSGPHSRANTARSIAQCLLRSPAMPCACAGAKKERHDARAACKAVAQVTSTRCDTRSLRSGALVQRAKQVRTLRRDVLQHASLLMDAQAIAAARGGLPGTVRSSASSVMPRPAEWCWASANAIATGCARSHLSSSRWLGVHCPSLRNRWLCRCCRTNAAAQG